MTKLTERHSRPVYRFAPIMLAGLLSACATTPDGGFQSEEVAVQKQELANLIVREPNGSEMSERGEDLYKLLIAEIAGHRGKIQIAVDNYLELARNSTNPAYAERATRIAVFARQDAAALEAAQIWARLAPGHLEARQVLSAMYIRAGQPDEARQVLENIMTTEEGDAGQKLRMIANFLSRERDKETALSVMESLVEEHQGNADALFAYALMALRAEKTDKARESMEKALKVQPLNLNMAMTYLGILQKEGDTEFALQWLKTVLTTYPDAKDLRMIYARMLADERQYPQAREQFLILQDTAPENVDVQFALGLLNLQLDKVKDARKNFERMLVLDGRVDEARYYLGQIENAAGNADAAEKWYSQVSEGPNYFDAQLQRVMLKVRAGHIGEGISQLRSIEVEEPEKQIRLIRIEADIHVQAGDLESALAVYNRELEAAPDSTDLLYSRAMLAEKLDRIDLLESDLIKVIEAEPDNAQALNALGYTLADRTERYEEALVYIKRALSISPNDFYILDSMGWILYRLGRLEEAVGYLRKAREVKDDPEIAAHLGEVLWVMGERDQAREVWDTALKASPDFIKLKDTIERFIP